MFISIEKRTQVTKICRMVVTTNSYIINKIVCLPMEPSVEEKLVAALLEVRKPVVDTKEVLCLLKESLGLVKVDFGMDSRWRGTNQKPDLRSIF